ncbi:hypothetical protein EDB83DRAFT_81750 [Lactarius deliciosus]|nr:hypothetical protein EDB83DRAFT_81750 [Lactarius deliciosus]
MYSRTIIQGVVRTDSTQAIAQRSASIDYKWFILAVRIYTRQCPLNLSLAGCDSLARTPTLVSTDCHITHLLTTMSQTPSTSTSSSNFRAVFVSALREYEKKTKTDLHTHPLATQLQSCQSSSDILAVLRDKVNEFDQSRSHNERLSSWLGPTINVLYAFSATLGEGVGLIFSPAKVISAGVGVLLLAAKDVDASQDALADLFERIENFFKRLESYTEVPPTDAMTDMIVKIMVEVLNVFAIATKEMKQGRASVLLPKIHECELI